MTLKEYAKRSRLFGRDDTAQAMVEYVVVVPIVLLMFFAAIQTGLIAQAAQLANYAAFSAARSYATSYSLFKEETGSAEDAHEKAEDRAKKAATLIMSPVSHAQLGEGLAIWNPIRGVVSGLPEPIADAAALLEGYVVASLYRLQDFTISEPEGGDNSSTATIRCTFEYWIPIALPGLVEIWNYLDRRGRGGAHRNTERMADYYGIEFPIAGTEVNETINDALDVLRDLEQWIPGIQGIRLQLENALIGISNIGLFGATYNVHIKAMSRVGFEPWSGTPIVGPDEADCEAQEDPEITACLEEYKQKQDEVNALKGEMEDVCNQVPPAEQTKDDKLSAYNTCRQDPNANCTTELNEFQSAESTWESRREACEVKTDEYEDARDELENSDAQGECLP